MSLYINPYWDAGTDEPSNLASALISLPRCHIRDYSSMRAISPLSNKSLTMPGACAGYVSRTVKAAHDCWSPIV